MMTQTIQQPDYVIIILECCEKKYKKLAKKNPMLKKCTENLIDELKTTPYLGEKLHANFPGCRSIHFLQNKYRLVYKVIDESEPVIIVLEIGHRKSSYSDLAKALKQGK